MHDGQLHNALAGLLSGKPSAPARAAPVEGAHYPERAPRNRVAVLGLVGQQIQEIQRAFGSEIDLRLVESVDVNRLRGTLPNMDAVIVMTKFVSHSDSDIVKAYRGNLINVNGGMTALREELRKFVRA